MKCRTLAIAMMAAAAVTVAPIAATPAMAQQNTISNAVATGLPITWWAITGGVLGAVVWPMVSTGAFVAAPINSVGALMNPGAAVGTVIGGVGYYMTR